MFQERNKVKEVLNLTIIEFLSKVKGPTIWNPPSKCYDYQSISAYPSSKMYQQTNEYANFFIF